MTDRLRGFLILIEYYILAKKKSKTQIKSEKFYELLKIFHGANTKCLNVGVHIFPQCLVDRQKWRVVIEFRDAKNNLKERKESDPKFYYTKEDLDIKIMELYIFYGSKV